MFGPTLVLVAALASSEPAQSSRIDIPFVRTTLPNGLVVIFHEDHSLPQIVVNLWYGVGSKDERAGRTGFAHLFEHLMFMGSKNVPYDLKQGAGLFDLIMESQGGTNNASTSNDRTNYFEQGPPELLETFLWLEADRLATLGDVIDDARLERQRKIVQNERRESVENRPYGKADLIIAREMFPPDHPYHHPVIGSHEDLEAATAKDARDFFAQNYAPTNASLVVAGDFEPARAQKMIERYFGWMPGGSKHAPIEATLPPLSLMKRVVETDDVELPRTYFVYHAPASFKEGSAETALLAAILGQGKSSRLERVLRLEKQLAQEAVVIYEPLGLAGLLHVVVTARPGKSLDDLERAVDAELEAIRKDAPAREEVDRARAGIEMQFLTNLEGLATRADNLNQYQFELGDPGRMAWDIARYQKVTAQEVQAMAARLLDPNKRLVLRIVPRERGAETR